MPAGDSSEVSRDLPDLMWLQTYRTPELEASAWLNLYRNPASFGRALRVDMMKQIPTFNAPITAFVKSVDQATRQIIANNIRQRPYLAIS